jgi:hypothetical protein
MSTLKRPDSARPGEGDSPPRLFVPKDSIVRTIWGRSDTILLIFAGAAAEFPLNKAVDWLYFTGRLPADPLGRLFSTVTYARRIVFAGEEEALAAIDQITSIHRKVESNRGNQIPAEAYLDVLFMLIAYSIRSYEFLERPLSLKERGEVFDLFHRVGMRMGLKDLPADYPAWTRMRASHLADNLVAGDYTFDLYRQYRKHLGSLRYHCLLQMQSLLVPPLVSRLLCLPRFHWIRPLTVVYKILYRLRLDRLAKEIILPRNYRAQVYNLDIAH